MSSLHYMHVTVHNPGMYYPTFLSNYGSALYMLKPQSEAAQDDENVEKRNNSKLMRVTYPVFSVNYRMRINLPNGVDYDCVEKTQRKDLGDK